MDSSVLIGRSFAYSVAWRAALIAVLAFLVIHLLSQTQYYATALILALFAVLLFADLARLLTRLDAPLARVMDALNDRSSDSALRGMERWIAGGAMADKTIALLQAERKRHAGQTDQLQGLLDTVSVTLIVLQADGSIALANRAAQKFAGESVGRLRDITALGAETAAVIERLSPGARRIVQLANGQHMLASMALFRVPGKEAERLLSLQAIEGELDAVQLKAWQDMTRVLAHEIMNSLTPIASLSESLSTLLRTGSPTPTGDAADALETIGRRSQGLMNFVERYRRIADLPEPQLKSIRLADFVSGIDALMQPDLARKNIAYHSVVTPPDLSLEADPELLSQAVINLIHNAADAVAEVDQASVTLSCSTREGHVVLEVADNGVGLAPEQINDIFVPFYTTKSSGSGIGLTLARQIALAHHGQIEARANEPRGVTFEITIPS